MGEEKRLENRRNPAENREKKNELKGGKKDLIGACILTGSLALGGAALGGCGSDNTGPRDTDTDGEVPASCDKEERARANLRVVEGWGYDEDGESRRCSAGKCDMGVNQGDEIMVAEPGGAGEKWRVDSVSEEKVIIKDPDTDKKVEVMAGGSLFIEGDQNTYVDVNLVGMCISGTCDNGVSADVVNAEGKAILSVTAGGETKRVLLADGERATVNVGGYTVNLTLARATQTQAYVIYDVSGGEAKAELGEPVNEGSEVELVDGVTLKNEVSSDSATVQCSKLSVKILITDYSEVEEGEEPVPFEAEFGEGDLLILRDRTLKVASILAETESSGYSEVVVANMSGVKFVEVDSGEATVLYKGESLDMPDALQKIEVAAVNVDRPVEE